MNRLLDPNLWRDSDNNAPPINWNAETGSYEFLTQSDVGVGLVTLLYQFDVPGAEDGDVIAFDYEVSQFVVDGDHQTTLYLQESSTGTSVWSVVVNDLPSGSVEIECTTGELYQFTMERAGGLTPTVYDFQAIITPTETPDPPDPPDCNYNCECDDEYPTRTLAQMREFLMIRLGWAAMKNTPLPGVVDTLNAFLQDAQEQLHAEYRIPRMERYFTWTLAEGVRFYDLPENQDLCVKELDPRQVTWVGISDGCDAWRKLVCGIPPQSYYGDISGLPTRYEIRQCIELWPPPSDANWKLRVKGYFYNERLEDDDDVASMDYQAVQLFALANAKAHYGQQDAANVMRQAMRYIANMTAGAHHTRRYVPGTTEWVAPPLPILTGYPGDP